MSGWWCYVGDKIICLIELFMLKKIDRLNFEKVLIVLEFCWILEFRIDGCFVVEYVIWL